MEKQLYYGAIFLDEISKKRLVRWWELNVDFPLYYNVIADRLILFYDTTEEELRELPLECIMLMRVSGFCYNHYCQTVVVEPEFPTADKIANITVAVNSPTPVYSNVAIARKHVAVNGPILTGELKASLSLIETIHVPRLELIK